MLDIPDGYSLVKSDELAALFQARAEVERLREQVADLEQWLELTRFSEQVAHESAKRQIKMSETLTEKWSDAAAWALAWGRAARTERKRRLADTALLRSEINRLRSGWLTLAVATIDDGWIQVAPQFVAKMLNQEE